VEPSPYSSSVTRKNSLPKVIQSWHKNGECSKGTIPIRRQLQTQTWSPPPHSNDLPKANPHYESSLIKHI
ncbi:2-methylacyl-CoA dehydrogenase mitochondrial, partial [Bienertia sinuspersici]